MDTRALPDYAVFDDYVYTQRVAVVVRWFLIVTWLILHNYKPALDETYFIINNVLALSLAANGLTNKEIAAELVITQNTARNHVSRILDKLGLTRRSEAARFAAQHGLLEEDSRE